MAKANMATTYKLVMKANCLHQIHIGIMTIISVGKYTYLTQHLSTWWNVKTYFGIFLVLEKKYHYKN